ncbi:unnamed protein product [Symbiodinium natans]|uniref:Uncharacterized protein n=1 Tax=Symbiodinium natans TaxID=878477 RepID=A0A812FZ49_9DINO|nr:unnamed protein product [Symbiodinium natans]
MAARKADASPRSQLSRSSSHPQPSERSGFLRQTSDSGAVSFARRAGSPAVQGNVRGLLKFAKDNPAAFALSIEMLRAQDDIKRDAGARRGPSPYLKLAMDSWNGRQISPLSPSEGVNLSPFSVTSPTLSPSIFQTDEHPGLQPEKSQPSYSWSDVKRNSAGVVTGFRSARALAQCLQRGASCVVSL